jgi:hypothetical protein
MGYGTKSRITGTLDRPLLPPVIALQRIPEKIETELAKAPPAKSGGSENELSLDHLW